MIRINFIKPRKPFKGHYEDWKRKWDAPEEKRPFRKLKEEDVIFCRKNYTEFGATELARMFNVHRNTIVSAAKGYSFQYLNFKCRPVA